MSIFSSFFSIKNYFFGLYPSFYSMKDDGASLKKDFESFLGPKKKKRATYIKRDDDFLLCSAFSQVKVKSSR
jgi:hypothetical protein